MQETKRTFDAKPFAVGLAIALPFVLVIAGTASDWVTIPWAKKVTLSVAAAAVLLLLHRVFRTSRSGCGTMITLYSAFILLEVFVMWIWN